MARNNGSGKSGNGGNVKPFFVNDELEKMLQVQYNFTKPDGSMGLSYSKYHLSLRSTFDSIDHELVSGGIEFVNAKGPNLPIQVFKSIFENQHDTSLTCAYNMSCKLFSDWKADIHRRREEGEDAGWKVEASIRTDPKDANIVISTKYSLYQKKRDAWGNIEKDLVAFLFVNGGGNVSGIKCSLKALKPLFDAVKPHDDPRAIDLSSLDVFEVDITDATSGEDGWN